jgi:hypothetical protein|tara:strand:+ start:173 stop:292 length:120 start_codon:yes stop_codon:yes gene_type:complete
MLAEHAESRQQRCDNPLSEQKNEETTIFDSNFFQFQLQR